jgi:hypothetical protein
MLETDACQFVEVHCGGIQSDTYYDPYVWWARAGGPNDGLARPQIPPLEREAGFDAR